jgi:hypothetical protein
MQPYDSLVFHLQITSHYEVEGHKINLPEMDKGKHTHILDENANLL